MEENKEEYLKRLMDRDIPRKAFVDKNGWFHCPMCNEMVAGDNFCKNCGQRLKNGN